MGHLAEIASVIGMLISGVVIHLINSSIPKICQVLIVFASSRLPKPARLTQRAAWLADFSLMENDLERANCAIGCLVASWSIEHPFALMTSRHRLRSSKNTVKLLGSVSIWCVIRVYRKGVLNEKGKIRLLSKYLIALTLSARNLLKPAIKTYFEQWIDYNTKYSVGIYNNAEDVQRAMIGPVIREIRIYRLLEENFSEFDAAT